MEHLPSYISITFALIAFLTLLIFYKATSKSPKLFFVILTWLGIQTIIALNGFYTVTNTIPPRFSIALILPLVLIAMLFFTARGRRFIDSLDAKTLTLVHIVRIPVELILLWLSIYKMVPSIMTFEGRNLDILSGITAPFIYYFGFVQKKLNRTFLLVWNFICLGLLLNIVVIAILAAPFPFQKLAFDQPNIAVLHFPFIWLPCFIVPVVVFAHLATIRQLIMSDRKAVISNNLPLANSIVSSK
jgi:hypothetical protein